jgi:hypothetical protein
MAEPVSIELMLDKPLYARTATYGYTSAVLTDQYKKTFKAGEYIGTIYSWINKNNQLYLQVYASPADYNNFKAIYVPIFESNLDIPTLKEAVAAKKAQDQMAADQLKKETVGTVQFYVEKYGPWILGAIVVIGVFPSILKSFTKNDK